MRVGVEEERKLRQHAIPWKHHYFWTLLRVSACLRARRNSPLVALPHSKLRKCCSWDISMGAVFWTLSCPRKSPGDGHLCFRRSKWPWKKESWEPCRRGSTRSSLFFGCAQHLRLEGLGYPEFTVQDIAGWAPRDNLILSLTTSLLFHCVHMDRLVWKVGPVGRELSFLWLLWPHLVCL